MKNFAYRPTYYLYRQTGENVYYFYVALTEDATSRYITVSFVVDKERGDMISELCIHEVQYSSSGLK